MTSLKTPNDLKEFFTEIAVRWYKNHPEADQNKTHEQMYIDYIHSFGHDGYPAAKETHDEKETATGNGAGGSAEKAQRAGHQKRTRKTGKTRAKDASGQP